MVFSFNNAAMRARVEKTFIKPRASTAIVLLAASCGWANAAAELSETPPPAYCAAVKRYDAIQEEAKKYFADDDLDGKWLERREWLAERDQKVTNDLSVTLGLSYEEWFPFAYKHNWTSACDRQASG